MTAAGCARARPAAVVCALPRCPAGHAAEPHSDVFPSPPLPATRGSAPGPRGRSTDRRALNPCTDGLSAGGTPSQRMTGGRPCTSAVSGRGVGGRGGRERPHWWLDRHRHVGAPVPPGRPAGVWGGAPVSGRGGEGSSPPQAFPERSEPQDPPPPQSPAAPKAASAPGAAPRTRPAARLVGPGVAHPDRRVHDAVHRLHGGQPSVQRLGGLQTGAGALTGQQHRDLHPGQMRAAPAGGQALHQLARGALAGLPGVLVRGEPMGGDQIEPGREAAGDIAVEIHGGGDQRVGPDRPPYGLGQVALGVLQAHDAHRAMDVVHQPVERTGPPQPLDQRSSSSAPRVTRSRRRPRGAG